MVASVLILLFFYFYLYPIVMKSVFGIDPQEKSILKRQFFIPRMPWPRQRRAHQSNDESRDVEGNQEKRMSDAETGMSPRSQFYKLNNGSALDLSRPNIPGSISHASCHGSDRAHAASDTHSSTSVTMTVASKFKGVLMVLYSLNRIRRRQEGGRTRRARFRN